MPRFKTPISPTPVSSPSAPEPIAPAPLSPDGASLIPTPEDRFPDLVDDGGLMDLADAVRRSLDYYRSLPAGTSFIVGPERVTAARMAESLQTFLGLMDLPPDEFQRGAHRLFRAYQSPGADRQGTVTFSAYYEHTLDASLKQGGEFQFPIYGRPNDLVEMDSPRGNTVGRYENGKLVPYFTRKEIDSGGALEGKGLEIAWAADPLDIFFLQVQGSGWLRIPGENKMLRVRFSAHNGRPYQSVGGAMIQRGLLKGEGSARMKMRQYMTRHREERQELLNLNPRYVFFKLDDGPDAPYAFGSIHRPLTTRRSVAADKALFPPGALAWMSTEKPRTSRFVLIQDEGGAIQGPGRIDYFVGAGKDAENYAVRFWTPGTFYVLVPR